MTNQRQNLLRLDAGGGEGEDNGDDGADSGNESEAGGGRLFKGASVLLFAAVAVLYVAARLWRLSASCLWFDEIFSVHAARHDWGEMLGFVAADIIHPPLFYALLKLWIGAGGESLLWLRLFPAIMSIAAIVPFVLLCRELRLGAAETKTALLLLAVNGYLIKYAQEVRMYSLLLLLSLCSLWLFARFFNADSDSPKRAPAWKSLPALFAVNLLLVYTHYYGWLVVAGQAIALLAIQRRKLPGFLLTVAALALCYVPWVYEVSVAAEPGRGVAQNIGWVARPGLADAAEYVSVLNTPFDSRQSTAAPLYNAGSAALALVLLGLPLAALLWRDLWRGRAKYAGRAENVGRTHVDGAARVDGATSVDGVAHVDGGRANVLWWLLIFAFYPPALAFALSWILPHSVWGTRHLIIAAAPYSILAAMALQRLRPFWLKLTILLVLGGWFFLAGALWLVRGERSYIWCAWEPLAGQLMRDKPDAKGAAQVYAFEDLIAYHLWFALARAGGAGYKVTVIKGVEGLREDPAYFLPRRFTEIATRDSSALDGDADIWVAFRDREWNERRPPLDLIEARGYRVAALFETKAQGQRAFLVRFSRNPGREGENR